MAAQMTQFPTTPKGRRTRSRLLASARRVLARNGYVSLKMVDVADEAGVSLGALYRYFRNKEDLFRALVDGIHEALFEASRAPNKRAGDRPHGDPAGSEPRLSRALQRESRRDARPHRSLHG